MLRRAAIWIVCGYGGLPAEGAREYRCVLVAKELAKRGFDVIWWTSSFNHATKQQRAAETAETGIEHFRIRLLQAPGYASNISLARIFSEWRFGRKFLTASRSEAAPELIILMDPARFYGGAVMNVVRRTGCRMVLDVLDLWPELFETVVPLRWRGLARLLLTPLYRQRNRLANNADAIAGVTADYVETVALPAGFRGPTCVARLGSHRGDGTAGVIPDEVENAVSRSGAQRLLLVYAGTLGSKYDIETMAATARSLADRQNLRWVVAGSGPLEHVVRELAQELGPDRFHFLGHQDAETIARMLQRCDVGLCCYGEGSTVSMPLKAYDYLAAGLPLINSLGRELGALVLEHDLGLQYTAGDKRSLTQAVSRMCDDADLRNRCAGNARALAREYDPSHQHRRYVDFLLEQVIRPQGSQESAGRHSN